MSLMQKTMNETAMSGARVGPMTFLGATNPVYAPDDGTGTGTETPAVVPAVADPVVPAVADPAKPVASVLYPDDAVKPAVADPAVKPEPAAGDPSADAEKEAAKAARKLELDAMTPEDRAVAEAADLAAEAEEVRLATVPEDGNYDLRMPEGVEIDEALMAELGPAFKDLMLNNGQAQELADKFIKAETAKAAAKTEAWAQTLAGWVETAKADPEMGGAKWDATVAAASGVVKRFGSPGLQEYLEHSGGGNQPEMIRFMATVGALIGEDTPAISETPGKPTPADPAAVLYPNDLPKKG